MIPSTTVITVQEHLEAHINTLEMIEMLILQTRHHFSFKGNIAEEAKKRFKKPLSVVVTWCLTKALTQWNF